MFFRQDVLGKEYFKIIKKSVEKLRKVCKSWGVFKKSLEKLGIYLQKLGTF